METEVNILFTFPSWEERSLLGFLKICKEYKIQHVVTLEKEFPINETETSCCTLKINDYCDRHKIKKQKILWKDHPISDWNTLSNLILQIPQEVSLYLDISTMPRDIIWTMFFFLRQRFKRFNIIYFKPKSYNDEWVSREPSSPRFLLKHSGIMEIGKPTCTVIITSFDTSRTEYILSRFEPQKVILCVPEGNQFNNESRNNIDTHSAICRRSGNTNVFCHSINAFSADFGQKTIENIISSLSEYNVIVSSFGPKTTAISTYLAYIKHPEIALCYVPCRQYNVFYSSGLGDMISCVFSVE